MLTITPIPAFSDNYIWCLADTSTGKALIVDPGQAEPVLDYLNANNLTLDTILITHHHPDHTGGVAKLQEACGPERIAGPAESPFKNLTELLHSGDELSWQGMVFQILAVPGHTLDHIAFYSATPVENQGVLFCGDTLFACGCGRLFEGTPAQMLESMTAIRDLPDNTAVYCAHEYTLANLKFARHWLPEDERLQTFEIECKARREKGHPTLPVSLGEEKLRNPFLRWDDQAVVEVAQHYGGSQGLDTHSATGVFAAVRHGKDHF